MAPVHATEPQGVLQGYSALPPCTRRQLIKESQFHIRAEQVGTHTYSPTDGSPGHHQEPHYNNHKILCVTIKPTAQEQHLNFLQAQHGEGRLLCLTEPTKVPSKNKR